MYNKDTEEIDANKRQEESHRKWRSFDPCTKDKPNLIVNFKDYAPLDPDPLPKPGFQNVKCEINRKSECRLHYELSNNINPVIKFNRRLNINEVKLNRHFNWKFLLNYSKAVQTNLEFNIVNTPLGVFRFNSHYMSKIFLPKKITNFIVAQFKLEIQFIHPGNTCYDHASQTYMETEDYLAKYPPNSFETRFFRLIDCKFENSWKKIKWVNCRDTMRYVYIWKNHIKPEDKNMTLLYKYNIDQTDRRKTENVSFKDFVFNLLYINYLSYVMQLDIAVKQRKERGPVNKNTKIDLLPDERYLLSINRLTGYRNNEIKLKDIPKIDIMTNFKLLPFWTLDENDENDYNVIRHFRFHYKRLHLSTLLDTHF